MNAPTIGIFDAALAAEARGLMKFKDMGNMTREEVDTLSDILMEYRKWTLPWGLVFDPQVCGVNVQRRSLYRKYVFSRSRCLKWDGNTCIYAPRKKVTVPGME